MEKEQEPKEKNEGEQPYSTEYSVVSERPENAGVRGNEELEQGIEAMEQLVRKVPKEQQAFLKPLVDLLKNPGKQGLDRDGLVKATALLEKAGVPEKMAKKVLGKLTGDDEKVLKELWKRIEKEEVPDFREADSDGESEESARIEREVGDIRNRIHPELMDLLSEDPREKLTKEDREKFRNSIETLFKDTMRAITKNPATKVVLAGWVVFFFFFVGGLVLYSQMFLGGK